MPDKLTEAEVKNLMWILLQGGEADRKAWREWRKADLNNLDTDLRRRKFLEIEEGSSRVRITEKGQKAIEELT
jgi:hypothetical protein